MFSVLFRILWICIVLLRPSYAKYIGNLFLYDYVKKEWFYDYGSAIMPGSINATLWSSYFLKLIIMTWNECNCISFSIFSFNMQIENQYAQVWIKLYNMRWIKEFRSKVKWNHVRHEQRSAHLNCEVARCITSLNYIKILSLKFSVKPSLSIKRLDT